ncbi:MAG: hypothetical protein NUW02_00750 [Candidatus Campbellbacteria bacterium]|nr:hypothetical protein [Candidatus Campbellbacteria bacterium]
MTKKLNGRFMVLQMRLNKLLFEQIKLNARVATYETQKATVRGEINFLLRSQGARTILGERVYALIESNHADASQRASANNLEIMGIMIEMNKEIPAPDSKL